MTLNRCGNRPARRILRLALGLLAVSLPLQLCSMPRVAAADLPAPIEEQLRRHGRGQGQDGTGVQEQEFLSLRERIRDCLDDGISPEELGQLLQSALENGVRARDLEEMLQQAHRTAAAGLPPAQVMEKAREGLVKRVEASRVVQAMERVRNRLELALGMVEQMSEGRLTRRERDRLTEECAAALAAGIEESHLREVVGSMSRHREMEAERLQHAVRLMKQAHGYGASSATARDLAMECVRKNLSARRMRQIARRLAEEKRRAGTVEAAALRLRHQVRQGSLDDDFGRSGAGIRERDRGGSGGSGSGGFGEGDHGGSGGGGSGSGGANSGGAGSGGSGEGGSGGSGGSGEGGSGGPGGSGSGGSGGPGGSGGSGGSASGGPGGRG